MTDNRIKQISEQADKVICHTLASAKDKDSLDNPFHCAIEIIDLVEWLSPLVKDHKRIANLVLKGHDWPEGTGLEVKRYFNLPY